MSVLTTVYAWISGLLSRCYRGHLWEALPAKKLARAKLAAQLCTRLPDGPGLWLRTTPDGLQDFYSVKDRNGTLYVVTGAILPIAVPVTRLLGYWVRLE